jgi:hypothetical protein
MKRKSGVSSSFLPEKMNRQRITRDTGLRGKMKRNPGKEIRCQFIILAQEIRCQFIILARKDEPTADYARHRITRKDVLT